MLRMLGRTCAAGLLLMAGSAQAQVVISQVYGGGGSATAPYNRDFVELYNRGNTAVALSGLSVQYASATGTGNFAVGATLPATTLQAGQYLLVGMASGAGAAPLPAVDVVGTSSMSGTGGKVALVNGTAALACNGGSTPCSSSQMAQLVDLVGFGAANFFEGSAPVAGVTATTAAIRKSNGCTDTDDNAGDFEVLAPAPRNTATPVQPCGTVSPAVLSMGDSSATEGNSGLKPFLFTVSLNRAADAGGVEFTYTTSDGTANGGSAPLSRTKGSPADYVTKTGTATIAEGQTSVTIQVDVIGDTIVEADETFFVDVVAVNGATLGNARGTGTIVNDDVVITPIHAIQGSGQRSPFDTQVVSTTGIVTGRRNNGFFLQSSDDEADADPATSEGIYVFTSSAPPAFVASGARVQVTGTVTEYVPTADPYQLPLTELTFATVSLVSEGNALPTPVVLTTALPNATGGLEQLERHESMRVTAPSFTVVAPTRGNISEANATATSNGLIAVVVTGTARGLREAGIPAGTPVPAGTTATAIPRWDYNPEVLVMDVDGLGAPLVDLAAGCRIIDGSGTGPLDYGFRRFTIYPEQPVQTDCSDAAPRGSQAPSADDATFATYNMQRFYDTTNDPATSDVVLTAAAYAGRLNKASLGIRGFLHLPDVLGVSEMENLATLQAVADKVNADVVAAGQPDPGYAPYLVNGFDVGGINVGFLVKTATVAGGTPRVQVTSVEQIGADAQLANPDGSSTVLNDRPPLVLTAVVNFADGRTLPVTVLAVHQRSLSGVDDEAAGSNGWATAGARVRAKRHAQAVDLATRIQAMQAADATRRIVVLGDFNAFDVNDGYVDAIGTVTGVPTPDDQTAVDGDGTSPVTPALTNMTLSVDPQERYSFVFDSTAQSLDHILVNQALVQAVDVESLTLSHARINADFPETARNDFNSALRLADHDPSVLLVRLKALTFADLGVVAEADAANVAIGAPLGYSVVVTNAGPDAADAPGVGFALDEPLADLAITAPAGWTCDTPTVTAAGTEAACNASTLANAGSATFTLAATAPAAAGGSEIRLVAAATSQTEDPDATDDSDSAVVLVASRADLSVAITGAANPPRTTTAQPYALVIANAGPSTATGVEVAATVSLPRRVVSVTAPAGWTCDVAGTTSTTLACRPVTGMLADQASATIALGIVTSGKLVHPRFELRADVDGTTQEAVLENNSAHRTIRVSGR